MQNGNNAPRFGEKNFERMKNPKNDVWYDLEVQWGPRYAAMRETADKAIAKYGLSESDFWILKKAHFGEGVCVYKGLIVSHLACLRIRELLPPEARTQTKFLSCLQADSHGYVFVYNNPERNLYVIGEATRDNEALPNRACIARNRAEDRATLVETGLYQVGIYGEVESSEFARTEPEAVPAPQPQQKPVQTAPKQAQPSKKTPAMSKHPVQPQQNAEPRACEYFPQERINKLYADIKTSGTVLNKVFKAYSVDTLEQLPVSTFEHVEKVIADRLADRRSAALAAAAEAAATGSPMPQQAAPQGISPIAAAVLGQNTEPAVAEPVPEALTQPPVVAESPLGETVYIVNDDAPASFKDMSGKSFDEIGKDMLRGLYKRKNAPGRKFVEAELLCKIEAYIA